MLEIRCARRAALFQEMNPCQFRLFQILRNRKVFKIGQEFILNQSVLFDVANVKWVVQAQPLAINCAMMNPGSQVSRKMSMGPIK